MKNSKKGFTLTEVLIVTAIIVILGGAAVAGIAVSIQNTKERGEAFAQSQGENWESEAVLEVKKTKVGLGVEQIYEESADTPAPDNGSTSDDKDLESTPTDAPADTPASTPADTPATTPGSSGTGSTGTGSTGTGSTGTGSTGTGSGSTGTGSGSSTSSGVTVTSATLTKQGTGTAGVVSYSVNGNSVSVQLYSGDNTMDSNAVTNISITKQNDGNYLVDFSGAGDKYWICSDKVGITAEDYYNGKKTKVMTSDEINSTLKLKLD